MAGAPHPTPDATAVQLACQSSLRLWPAHSEGAEVRVL